MMEKLRADLKDAMRAKDEVTVRTLRMLMAELKHAEVEKIDKLDEKEFIALVQRGVKKRKEAIEQYEKAGRNDLAEKERAEIAVLERYLPKQLSEEEVVAIVERTIAETGATTKRDLGKVMKAIMSAYRGQVDGKLVQRLVSERLA